MVGVYVCICLAMSVVAVKRIIAEQALKTRVGKGLIPSDIRFNKKTVRSCVITAFIGGWASGCLGLSGGAIFNPLLLNQGVPPSVASATGMYMILFSTIGTTIVYSIQGSLNFAYGGWIGGWCAIASVGGMYALDKIVKKFGRQSPLVFVLTGVLALSTVLVPIFGYIEIHGKFERDPDNYSMWSIQSYC